MFNILFILGLFSIYLGISKSELIKVRACEGHIMKLLCNNDEIIKINWANYGRTDKFICNYFEDNEDSVDCRNEDATDIVKRMCDGKSVCFVKAINENFGDPCPDQVKYVETIYECVPKSFVKLDPHDLTVEMQEKELLQLLKNLGEKDSNGQDLKSDQALGLLNLFANVEANKDK